MCRLSLVPTVSLCLASCFAVGCSGSKVSTQEKSPPPQESAIVPVPRGEIWVRHHKSLNNRARKGDYDLVFIGDSITEGWANKGKAAWGKYYAPRKALNLGIGGDRTQHVLWRLDNGNIDGLKPKLAVIMIGTNNVGSNPPEEVAEGIKLIVDRVRQKMPDSKILLLGIFPRDEKPDTDRRQANAKASEIASQIADNETVFYLDIGDKFLTADGILEKEIMPDRLHLTPKGYEIWAEAIEPKVAELMGDSGPSQTQDSVPAQSPPPPADDQEA